MQFGFSTLGAPDISYAGAQKLASEFGLDFLELRGLEGSLDLPGYFRAKPPETPRAGPPPPVLLLGSSLCLTKAAPGDVEKVIELAELAAQLRAPYLRVFGSGDPNIAATKEALKSAAKLVRELRTEIARHGWKVELLLETHDAFCTSARCHALIEVLDEPLAILWDSHHTWRLGSETIEQTWGELGPLIRHVHYKDSTAQPDTDMGYGYVLPGEGEFPTQALFRLLKTEGYPRGVSLEWEKLWHPKLAPMEVALTAFLKVIKKNT